MSSGGNCLKSLQENVKSPHGAANLSQNHRSAEVSCTIRPFSSIALSMNERYNESEEKRTFIPSSFRLSNQ